MKWGVLAWALALQVCFAQSEDLTSTNLQVDQFRAAVDEARRPVTVVSFGDSIADSSESLQLRLFVPLQERFGTAGYSFRNYRNTAVPQLEKGAVYAMPSTNWWMEHFVVPRSGAVWWSNQWHATGSLKADCVGVYWIAHPDGGFFSFQLSTNGAPWQLPIAVLDGRNPEPEVRFTNIVIASGMYRVRVESLTGTNLVLGATQLDRSSNGMHIVFLTSSGANQLQILRMRARLTGVLRGLDPDLIVWHFKDLDLGETILADRLAELESVWDETLSHGDVVYVGTPFEQRDSTNTWTLRQNRIVRAAAVENNRPYVDCMMPCVSYESMVANHYMADVVHLNAAGNRFLAEIVGRELGFHCLRANRRVALLRNPHRLEWLATTGVVYNVEASTNFLQWTTIHSVPGDNMAHQMPLAPDSPERFFRLNLK
jgi:hypothetical protein